MTTMAIDNKNTVLNAPSKGNVPALRFPEFSGEWEDTSLDNECTINPISDKLETEFVYVDLESVEKGELTKMQVIEKGNAPSRAQRVLRNGDILFQCVRPYQKNNYLVRNVASEIQWVASTGYAQLRTDRNNPAFIYHLINTSSFNKKVIVRCTGSSYPAINSDDLSKIHFYICGIEEQKRIADFLSLLDERISIQSRIIEKYETLIKGIVVSHYSKTARTIKVRIRELGEAYSTKVMSKEQLTNDGNLCVFYGELFTLYGCVIDEVKSRTSLEKVSSTLSHGRDLLFPASTTVDAVSLIAPSALMQKGIILGGDMFGIKVSEAYNPIYLSYYFNYIANKRLAKYAKGTTIIHLHYNEIANVAIELPNIEEQDKIVSTILEYSAKLSIEETILEKLFDLKQYLLKQLFI